MRARILLSMQQATEALPDVEKAITLAPEEETSYLLRGRIHEAMGNIDAAAADYQNVLELNPFNDKDGAFEDLKKSIELNPEGDEARKLEGQHTNFNDMYKGGIF